MRTQITIEHCVHESDRSFDDLVAAFEAATGSVEEGFATVAAGIEDAAGFEATFTAREGTSGFMRFLRIDHSRWLPIFGIEGRSVMYVLGNPLIPRTMIAHDIGVGLYVPIRLAIEQAPDGKARVVYDLPSTQMGALANADVTAAARQLDAKLIALAEAISGIGA